MSLSDQNRALIERIMGLPLPQNASQGREIVVTLGSLHRLLDAARAEGRPSPEDAALFSRCYEAMARAMSVIDVDEGPGRLHSEILNLLAAARVDIERRSATISAFSTPSPEAGREEDLRAEVLAIFKANKMATDERLAILIAERLAPRLSPPAPEREEIALGEPHTLAACPPGLFLAEAHGTLGMKTEYYTDKGAVEAYIVESGEFFWGDAPQTPERQRAQIVRPISHDAILQRLSNQQGGEG